MHDDSSLPTLLRRARRVYGDAIRRDLGQAGYADIPANGIVVLTAVARASAPLADVIRQLGMSKQAAGQLVDALVLRGYLQRDVDDHDRRRLNVSLTARGRAAATVVRQSVRRIDARLAQQVAPENLERTRATLLALIAVGHGP